MLATYIITHLLLAAASTFATTQAIEYNKAVSRNQVALDRKKEWLRKIGKENDTSVE